MSKCEGVDRLCLISSDALLWVGGRASGRAGAARYPSITTERTYERTEAIKKELTN